MPQVKKAEGRDAILAAAADLFARKGYRDATMRELASAAGMSLANVYVYFRSKYQVLFEINDPWMRDQFDSLERRAMRIKDARKRLRYIVTAIWRDIPNANNAFPRNIMQALSEVAPGGEYDPTMLRWMEEKINKLLLSCMSTERAALFAGGQVAHIMMMAFDGFAINATVNPAATCDADVVEAFCELLLPSCGAGVL
jgi:AcrR family transcriptional regulator